MPRHELTPEERAKGGRNRAAAIRRRRTLFEERLSAELEEQLEAVVTVFKDALAADLTIVTKDGDVYTVPAHAVRLRAATQMIHETYGRPTQRVEVTGEDGDPVQLEHRGVNLEDVLRVARESGLVGADADRDA